MKSIETSGKTVETAVKNGLKELGCEYSDVDIEILEMGSPGLFGMFGKLAKVRLTVKDKEDDEFKIDMPVFTLDIGKEKKPAKKEAPRQEKPKAEPKSEPKA
ncbi:MAG: Jag N-terminal domain-containing protein, partial [Eubacteriales bacterium]|nr:Jag N-terminal domain-containing protein [Eubacteriales bacterium]